MKNPEQVATMPALMSLSKTLTAVSSASLCLSLFLSSSPARAEAPGPAAVTTPAPDVVNLKNGGIVRGTISELIPDDKVIIMTVTGDVRTYPMSDVTYAGPAKHPDAAPAAPTAGPTPSTTSASGSSGDGGVVKPRITVQGQEARVHFEGDTEGLTFSARTGSAIATNGRASALVTAYDEICSAPCDATMPAGYTTLAVSKDAGPAVEAEPVDLPAGSSQVTATYVDNSGTRTFGTVLMIAGPVVGLTMVVLSASGDDLNTGLLYAGTGITCGSLVLALPFTMVSDTVTLSVAPGAPSAITPRGQGEPVVADRSNVPRGLTLQGTF